MTSWMMPEAVEVFHSAGRSRFSRKAGRFEYYELDASGNLAIVGDGTLIALFPAGKWEFIRAVF
jgi:hypothetical protein